MYRILIADDEPIERMVVTRKINKNFSGQFEIVQAQNGREAVELFEQKRFDIIFMDIEMPGINGLKAAEMIRSTDKKCSIIFLTAFDEFNYARKAISVRALDYLLKPGDENELIAVIEEAVRIADDNREYVCQSKKSSQDIPKDIKEQPEPDDESVKLSVVTNMILKYIEEHYREDISLQSIAETMNYSEAYFCKLFKQCFDKSFTVFLTEYRIERAKELLSDVIINIKDVGREVGYRDSNYFTKVFKRMVGVTPTEYRMNALKKAVLS